MPSPWNGSPQIKWFGHLCFRPISTENCTAAQFSQQELVYCDAGWVGKRDVIESTATLEFGMLCDDDWKKPFAQSLYMAGMLVGSFVFGTLADFIGRRATLVVTCLLLASSGSICALLPSSSQMYSAFATLRFLMGMGHVGTFMQSFTLSVEYVGPERRTLCGCFIEVAFALGNGYNVQKKIMPVLPDLL